MHFEQLNKVSCRINDIQNNDKIPIGGTYLGKFDLIVTADIDKFEKFFQAVEKNADNFEKNEAFEKWVGQIAPEFDAKTFAHLYAFDNILRKMYPNLSSNISERKNFYDNDNAKTLSQAVEAGVCQCAEIALLAQAYCQRNGFDTKYFGGELLCSPSEEFGEAHSFIALKTEKGDCFYDPAQPLLDKSGVYYPRIQSIESTEAQKKQFENIAHATNIRRKCAFLETKDILTQKTLYYGYGDGANIFPSFILSKNSAISPTAKER